MLRLPKIATFLLLAGLGSFAHSSDGNKTTPLLETTRALDCAANPTQADAALNQLKLSTIADVEMPNEWFGTDRNPQLHAATFDIIIDVILDNIERFPETTEIAESVLLGWNYCAVYHSGNHFDLTMENGQLTRQRADASAPRQWQGFERLGISQNGEQRYTPKAFSSTQKSIRQQVVYDWWTIQRTQCLPHPGTGELYYQRTLFGPSKVTNKPRDKSTEYPYEWNNDCAAPYTREEHKRHALKLAQEKTAQDQRKKAQAEQTLANTKKQELQQLKAKQALAKQQAIRLDAEQALALAKEQQLKQKAEQARSKEAQREQARLALQERARAYAAQKNLEKEASELEAANIALAEREQKLAQQQQQQQQQQQTTPIPPVAKTTVAATKPQIVQIPLPAAIRSEQKTPAKAEQTTDSYEPIFIAKVNTPAKSRAKGKTKDKTKNRKPATNTSRSLPAPSAPEVFITEEPRLAAAIVKIEQTSGQNLPSTAPQSTSSAFPSSSVPPFEEQVTPSFKDRKYHGFSGSFALSNKGLDTETDAWSFSANFGYKPIRSSYFFARTGFTWKPDDTDPSYYWGIGYNDWHTGTFAFELNHWGPLKPGDGLQLEKVVASLSYKFDSELLKKNGLSSSFSVSGGENSSPAATFAGSWTPKPKWFIRTLITQPLEGGDMTWAYGFGFSDWREKTWALEYNNWGTNKAFDLNFRDNALVTLSWKWGF